MTTTRKNPAASDYRIPTARRRHKGKYLQTLMIDLAREVSCIIPVSSSSYATFVHREGYQGVRAATDAVLPDTQARSVMAILGAAIAKRIFIMTGARRFELVTWITPNNMQELSLRLYSEQGWSLVLAAHNHSAHKHMQALAALSDCMDLALGSRHRADGDLERFLVRAADTADTDVVLPNTWRASCADAELPGRGAMMISEDGFLGRSTTTLASRPHDIEAARSRLPEERLPRSIQQIEAYEAAVECEDDIRMTNRLSTELRSEVASERRFEELNPTLRAGLSKRSRNIKDTGIDELISLADELPLTHLAVEFGISDVALAKRLKKAGWVNPRSRSNPRYVFGHDTQAA